MTLLCVLVGAAVGAPLRYAVAHVLDGRLPWGTVLVNVTGSFALGALSASAVSGSFAALLGVGLCGTFTTYSAFVVQVHDRGPWLGLLTVLLTVPVALTACGLGFALVA